MHNKLSIYADRPDLEHVHYHVGSTQQNKDKPRFAKLHKETENWTAHHTKYNDAETVASGTGEKSMHDYFNKLHKNNILDENKTITDTLKDDRNDNSSSKKYWSHGKLIKMQKHDRTVDAEIKRRISSKEYIFTKEKDLNEMFEERFNLDEALRLNPDLIGKTFTSHAEGLKGKAGEYNKIADAERHGKNYSIYKRYMGSNKIFHHVVVDNDEDKIISQSTSADAALKKADLHPVHIINESLNEISKDTLISYDDKARKSAGRLSKSISSSNDREYRQELMGNSKAAERIFFKKKDNQNKLDKRYDGMKRANDVLYPDNRSVIDRIRKNSKIGVRINAYNKPIAEDLDSFYSNDNEIKHKLKTIMTICDHMYHLFDLGENIPYDLENKLDDILSDLEIFHDEVLDPIEDEIEDYYEDEDETDEEDYGDDIYENYGDYKVKYGRVPLMKNGDPRGGFGTKNNVHMVFHKGKYDAHFDERKDAHQYIADKLGMTNEATYTDVDKILVHRHKMGTDMGRYGVFNVEKVTPTQLHAHDYNTGKTIKFNLKTKRGIGDNSDLLYKRKITEDLNEVSKDTLKSYIKSAKTDKLYRKAYAETGVFDTPEDLKKLSNRKFGLKTAKNLLSNKE